MKKLLLVAVMALALSATPAEASIAGTSWGNAVHWYKTEVVDTVSYWWASLLGSFNFGISDAVSSR